MLLCLPYSIFFGTTPTYIIADMDLVKEITVKHFDKFTDRLVGGGGGGGGGGAIFNALYNVSVILYFINKDYLDI